MNTMFGCRPRFLIILIYLCYGDIANGEVVLTATVGWIQIGFKANSFSSWLFYITRSENIIIISIFSIDRDLLYMQFDYTFLFFVQFRRTDSIIVICIIIVVIYSTTSVSAINQLCAFS